MQTIVCLLTLGGATQTLAQGLEGYTLKETKKIGNITEKTYVQEDDFGNVKQSYYMWEKKNGDYYISKDRYGKDVIKYKHTVPKYEKDGNEGITPIGTVYTYENGIGTITYPNGNKLVNVNRKEDLVSYEAFQERDNGWGITIKAKAFGNPNNFAIDKSYQTAEKPLMAIPAKQTEGYRAVFDIMVVGQQEPRSGFSKGDDRIYMVTLNGEFVPYLQKIPYCRDDNGTEYYYWACATDDIEKLTNNPTTIHYKNGDLIQYPGPNMKLHRNGGTYLHNNTSSVLKFADGSRFEFASPAFDWFKIVKPEMVLTDGWLIKTDGTKEQYKNGVNLAKKAAEEEAKEKKRYNALCQKYGKAHVDRLKRETVWIGMPEGLLKESYKYTVEHRSTTSTQYYLYNIMDKPFKSVWVSRGRVTSITNF